MLAAASVATAEAMLTLTAPSAVGVTVKVYGPEPLKPEIVALLAVMSPETNPETASLNVAVTLKTAFVFAGTEDVKATVGAKLS